MAITQTGAMYKSLSFDNTSSRNYGVYITGEAVYNAPERAVEMISIPGRNGAFALDQGRFENIEVSYPAGIFADNETDFAQAVSDFRNFLCSKKGYCRLTDEYNPNEYRMAVYKSGLEVDPAQLRAGEFTITFDCKPQRWLTDGETPVDIGTWGDTDTESGSIVEVDNPDGILAIKDLQADIVAVQPNAYSSVWVGGAGKNKLPTTTTQTVMGITFTANADGTVTANGTATAGADCYFVGASGVYDYISNITTGSYKLSGNTLGGGTSTLFIVQEGGTILAQQTDGNDATVTLDSTKKYRIFIRVNSGKTLSNQKYYPMLRASTETSTFEPYENVCPISGFTEVKVYVSPTTQQADATVYTIDLDGTRYGGTLDVTSGVLTVTHKLVNCDGSEQWGMVSSGYFTIAKSNLDATLSTTEAHSDTMICNRLPWLSTQPNTTESFNAVTHTVRVSMPSITSLANFKTYLSNNNLQFLLKLATPTTVQLTAQEIELLQGANNVWASTGDVEVEYGNDPNKLPNPTMFESSPLLEVEGYGNISNGDFSIQLNNEVLGSVQIAPAFLKPTPPYISEAGSYDISLNTTTLNVGDIFKISNLVIASCGPNLNGWYFNYPVSALSASNSDATVVYNQTLPNKPAGSPGGWTWTSTLYTKTTVPEISFVCGTDSIWSNIITISNTPIYNGSDISQTDTITVTITQTISYDSANSKITITVSVTTNPNTYLDYGTMRVGFDEIRGDSSQSQLGHPTYIDCDLGEVYKIVGGQTISLNRNVDLGSDLPTLASGVNTITYDNTITQLKVTPRWWKV